ncbi:MAG: hypothetical protein V7L01_23450 [Nostoc sp.]
MINAIITMQLITVSNGVACRRTQSVSKSWHRILILFKISVLPEAIASATVLSTITKALEEFILVQNTSLFVNKTSLFVHKTSPFVHTTSLLVQNTSL